MKPKKIQLNDEQKKSISLAKGGTVEKIGANMRSFTNDLRKRKGAEVARKYAGPAESHNLTERRTFKNSQVSIKTLEAKLKKHPTLDQGVSGDALARVRAGKPAKYYASPLPLRDEDK